MIHPRVALAAGFGAVVVAGLLMSGRLPGSVFTVLVLVVAARAGVLAAAGGVDATHALHRHLAVAPAWVLVTFVAAVRAGSADLEAVRGAHAVAGLSLARGDVLVVVGCWLALAAAVGSMAIVWRGRAALITADPFRRLEVLVVLAEAAFVVTLFVGPQVRGAADALVWLGSAVAVVAVAFVARARSGFGWAVRVPLVLSAAALALVLIGDPL